MKQYIKEFWEDSFIRTITQAAVLFVIMLFIMKIVLLIAFIPTESMYPTIQYPSLNIGFRGAYLFKEPQRGDIIYFRSEEMGEILIKRIVGVPGDKVEEIDGQLYINGDLYTEPYLAEQEIEHSSGPFVVPDNCYLLMGDNRNHSYDARYWGNPFIERSEILAKQMISLKIIGMG